MPEFDPRKAALNHASLSQIEATEPQHVATAVGHLAQSIACGLVYVGDQIRQLRDEPPRPGHSFEEMIPAIREQALAVQHLAERPPIERQPIVAIVNATLDMARRIVENNDGITDLEAR